MDITVVGLGHVGLVDSLVLGSYFHNVIGFDPNKEHVETIREGVSPFEEPFLQDLLKETRSYVQFTSIAKDAIRLNSIIAISVETHFNGDGSINLDSFDEALEEIAKNVTKDSMIVIRSTVPPGTNRRTKKYLEEHCPYKFNVVTLPAFGSQGRLVESVVNPARIVIGVESAEVGKLVKNTLSALVPRKAPVFITTPENAELIKWASNLYIGMHVSFINSLARLADVYSANIDTISQGLSQDPRINGEFLHASFGYGGQILPFVLTDEKSDKDVIDYYTSDLFKATIHSNEAQIKYFIDKIYERFRSVSAKKIAVLGAAFKAGTEDIRNSPSIHIMRFLLDKGAFIRLYDPLAEDKVAEHFSRHTHITYYDYPREALKGADFCLILNDSKEFKELTAEDFKKNLRKPIIFDGKNLYSLADMEGTEYHSIGRRTTIIPSLID